MTTTLPLVTLDTAGARPLVDQIVTGISRLVDGRALRSGTRLPSIRRFAEGHRVSTFTVVESFDKLVAMGYLVSRRGSGFYVADRASPKAVPGDNPHRLDRAMDVLWLMRNALQADEGILKTGSGWLPASWLDEPGVKKGLRALSRKSGAALTEYGDPKGYPPLRQQIRVRLDETGIAAEAGQIVLTHGASHALDLTARYLLKPGDAVLVNDPGYFSFFGYLRAMGATLLGVPQTAEGPDPAALEALVKQHRPKVFYTSGVLHNPTGTSASPAVAHRILQVAEKYGLTIVEDDVYGDFHPGGGARLATLDQLNRVIYVGGYSKTISCALRVGYIAASPQVAEDLLDLKLLMGVTTSQIGERLIHEILADGHYRKHMDRVRAKLQTARAHATANLENLGLTPYGEPLGGMFLWAKLPEGKNAETLASAAAKEGITLAPGSLFRPHQEPSDWMRFNVAHSQDKALYDFLARQL
jgi:DNA-binding transcriptional MocR family regulator